MVTAKSLPLPPGQTALPCLRALPHSGQGLGAPDGSGSPAMQDPATAALSGVPRPLLGSSPLTSQQLHPPLALSQPVSRTCRPGLRALQLPEAVPPALVPARRYKSTDPGPKSCRTYCCNLMLPGATHE